MGNDNLLNAKSAKYDEFYTLFSDIEKEINAYLEFDPDLFEGKTLLLPCDDPEWSNFTKYFAKNFGKLRLKKLISTSYAPNSKPRDIPYQPPLFEIEDERFDEEKTVSNGKIFTLTKDRNGDKKVDVDDLEWSYLEGDGDFRSEEVTKLRDQADFVITNPPFSLFREFLAWLLEGDKKFSMIANKGVLTTKSVFPLVITDKVWVGKTPMSQDLLFTLPKIYADKLRLEKKQGSSWREIDGVTYGRSPSIWLTNLEHGKRHQPLALMSQEDNIKFSKHKEIKGRAYIKYDNYDAVEVPFTDAIPSDYPGVMGVPISFLDKYNPEQFEILGCSEQMGRGFSNGLWDSSSRVAHPLIDSNKKFSRIFIRHRGLK